MREKKVKHLFFWLLSIVGAALLGYLFRNYLLLRIYIPIYVLPLLVILSAVLAIYSQRVVYSRKRFAQTKAYRQIIKPGMRVGMNTVGGKHNLIAVEWSLLNPNVLIAQDDNGNKYRIHSSIIIVYI